jgi:hypothetical protein
LLLRLIEVKGEERKREITRLRIAEASFRRLREAARKICRTTPTEPSVGS